MNKVLIMLAALIISPPLLASKSTTSVITKPASNQPMPKKSAGKEKASVAQDAILIEDFDSLGGNRVLLKQVQALRPNIKVQVVQNRLVSRRLRNEFTTEYSSYLEGKDNFLNTENLGINYQFHINPYWSLGLKYSYHFNELSSEGDKLISGALTDEREVPELDWPKQSYMAIINWYPIYGKFKIMDSSIVHFDMYVLAGGGNIDLRVKKSPTYVGGLGVGLWFNDHLTSRLEFRYQTYTSQRVTGQNEMNLMVAAFQIGYML